MSSSPVTKLENLSNEIQLMILSRLSLPDLYYSFFGLNERFNALVNYSTPEIIRKDWLNNDIKEFFAPWWGLWDDKPETFTYYLVPQLLMSVTNGIPSTSCLRWVFLLPKEFDRFKEQHRSLGRRFINILSQYKLQLDLTYLVAYPNIYSVFNGREKIEPRIKESYPDRHAIMEADGKFIKPVWSRSRTVQQHRRLPSDSLRKIHRQQKLIYRKATQIWKKLKTLKNLNLLDVSVKELV
jgi:hypothetical protein